MKAIYKNTKKLLIVLVIFSFAGCEGFLDRYPDNALTTEQMYSEIEYAEAPLIALYDLLSDSYFLGRNVPLRGSLKGTDFFHFVPNPNLRFDQEYKYAEIASDAGYAGYLWNYCYRTIANSNSFLSSLPNYEGEEIQVNDFKAQAMTIKAIAYLELLRAFSYPLWMGKDDEAYNMGVPLIKTAEDNSNAIDNPPSRESLQDSYDYIIELLTEALPLIDKTRVENYYITEQAIHAILANVYLYTEQWGLAKDEALLAESLGGSMISKTQFISSMTQRFNNESVFEIYYDANDNLALGSIAYYAFKTLNSAGRIDASSTGYGEYGASNAFINLFSANDIRTQLFKEDKTSALGSVPGGPGYSARAYHKYIGIESEVIHDVAYIRLPQILLVAAEAYSEIPDDGNALNYLNKVFSARTDSTLTGLSGQALKTAIFNERRRELALEGHEIFDYLRKKRAFSRDGSHPAPLSIDPVNGRQSEHFHQVVYPIPQTEMDANPNIRDQQNPGYADYQGSGK